MTKQEYTASLLGISPAELARLDAIEVAIREANPDVFEPERCVSEADWLAPTAAEREAFEQMLDWEAWEGFGA